jgi:hypothetical protein
MNDYQCYGTPYIENFVCQTTVGNKRGYKPKSK